MPATAADQRQAIADLSTLAASEVRAVLGLLEGATADQVRDALMDILPTLGAQYGDAAALLAAEWFEELRADAEVPGTFRPVLAQQPTSARWEALARWGVDPLYATTPDMGAALTLITGGLQRTIADQHRLTIADSSVADPRASGWSRNARPGACKFCQMLADRPGAVYTEASVEFKAHDHCMCTASPSWAPNVTKVIGVPFRYSQRKANWSDERRRRENQRVYDHLAD